MYDIIRVHGFSFKKLETNGSRTDGRGEFTRYQDPYNDDLTLHVRVAPDPHEEDGYDCVSYKLNYRNVVSTIWCGTAETCFEQLLSLYDFMSRLGLAK